MIKTIKTKIENWHLKRQLNIKDEQIKALEERIYKKNEELCNLKHNLVSINAMLEEKNERGTKKDKSSNNK